LELELADRIDTARRRPGSEIDLRERADSVTPEIAVQTTGDLVLQRVS
jgi:hypothetical protein